MTWTGELCNFGCGWEQDAGLQMYVRYADVGNCRKKAEQAPRREAIQQEREQNVDVGGVLGQTGGPANPIGKNNYPNSGD